MATSSHPGLGEQLRAQTMGPRKALLAQGAFLEPTLGGPLSVPCCILEELSSVLPAHSPEPPPHMLAGTVLQGSPSPGMSRSCSIPSLPSHLLSPTSGRWNPRFAAGSQTWLSVRKSGAANLKGHLFRPPDVLLTSSSWLCGPSVCCTYTNQASLLWTPNP